MRTRIILTGGDVKDRDTIKDRLLTMGAKVAVIDTSNPTLRDREGFNYIGDVVLKTKYRELEYIDFHKKGNFFYGIDRREWKLKDVFEVEHYEPFRDYTPSDVLRLQTNTDDKYRGEDFFVECRLGGVLIGDTEFLKKEDLLHNYIKNILEMNEEERIRTKQKEEWVKKRKKVQ